MDHQIEEENFKTIVAIENGKKKVLCCSGATLGLSWALGTFAFVGPFPHNKNT